MLPEPQKDPLPGLFCGVVGPSGAGKDSLIDALRLSMGEDGPVRFVRRSITRPADAGGEAHEALSEIEFESRVQAGQFALHWRAHGLSYGVPKDIDATLASGKSVLVNLSRSVIDQVRERYANRKILIVTASPEVLASRLAARGRESAADVEARLRRASLDMPKGGDVVTILNDGSLADSAKLFKQAITGR